ncbi:DUF302 domain-containing protein [Alicyclobacillus sp. SO9]|uniref:DUF302 domain-containing protein n=1 Tax=Alicyclobacillus sp. SO9 TaxID=2665646 RepID=UPI0018E736AC|nr:DUF302 domain-containing protein [Alicyclobacillus sp. SO9]QQE78429.1 DUF302 domain-containing protein [Alicyclobacillus sp. SO9]
MFDFTIETEKTVEEAISAVEESLKGHRFGVLWKLDLRAKLQEKGVEFTRPYHVLEACNPVEAKKVLEQNRLGGYFLPCKLVVYQEQQKTKIGLTRPTTLTGLLDDAELSAIAADVEKELIAAVQEAQ